MNCPVKPRASQVELGEIGMVFELSCEDQQHTGARVRAQIGGYEPSQKDPRSLLGRRKSLLSLRGGKETWKIRKLAKDN